MKLDVNIRTDLNVFHTMAFGLPVSEPNPIIPWLVKRHQPFFHVGKPMLANTFGELQYRAVHKFGKSHKKISEEAK